MTDEVLDMVIVGAGPAGIAAALEASRRRLSVLLVSDGPVGGLVNAARRIDNLPGWPGGVGGRELAAAFVSQLESCGISPVRTCVTRVDWSNGSFSVTDGKNTWAARTVVMAPGTRPKPFLPELPESPNILRDVSGLPAEMPGVVVAVIGSGEAAVDSAMNLADRGASVTLFCRAKSLHGCDSIVSEFFDSGIAVAMDASLWFIQADDESVTLKFDGYAEWRGRLAVFCIGRESRLDEVYLNDAAGIPGMFFAGDILHDHDRYVALAMGDGQRAACLAHEHIEREAAR